MSDWDARHLKSGSIFPIFFKNFGLIIVVEVFFIINCGRIARKFRK